MNNSIKRIPFNPTDEFRKTFYTASSYATSKGWSPYNPDAKVNRYIADQGHHTESRLLRDVLGPNFKKVKKSFLDEDMNLVGTPDFKIIGGNQYPFGTYGEIKSVLKTGKNLQQVLNYWYGGNFDLDMVTHDRNRVNIFSHIVQCILNMYLIGKSKAYNFNNPFILIYYFANFNQELRSLELNITDEEIFIEWVESSLFDEEVNVHKVTMFLKVTPTDISKSIL